MPLAGATWIMRAPIRREYDYRSRSYVSIARIGELRKVEVSAGEIAIGACVTHAQLVAELGALPECRGLVAAAGSAANPAIRRVATIGGNLCAARFAASDLVPALLSAGAEVELCSPLGTRRVSMEGFLGMRSAMDPGTLLHKVIIARSPTWSAHARLPLRKAGDYPVAIVSMSATLGLGGMIEQMSVAVGSVEPVARRWPRLEAAMIGSPLDADRAHALATADLSDFNGREGIEAPGWYRVQVLPALIRKAVDALQAQP